MDHKAQLLYPELSYKIRGCFFRVYHTLGFGHKESVYHRALTQELRKQGIAFEEEKVLDIFYDNEKVGTYRPDFVIEGKIILEVKAQDFLNKEAEIQLTHYLKSSRYKLGFIVNFGSSKLDIRRRVWSIEYQRKSAMISVNQ